MRRGERERGERERERERERDRERENAYVHYVGRGENIKMLWTI